MSKFTKPQRTTIKSLVAAMSIKRIPDSQILKEVEKRTGMTISQRYLTLIKHYIKKDSKDWYDILREGEYEYIHEFKERINEIVDLQKRHYKIIDDNPNNPVIQQTSLAELHRLNITLSNYFDVAPTIVNIGNKNNGDTIPIPQKDIIV